MKCKIPEISWHNRDPVLSVDIQPKSGDGAVYRLASGGTDAHVLIWFLNAKDHDIELDLAADLTRHQRAVNVVKWSPNGELLASGDDESVVFIWKQKAENEVLNITEATNEQDKEVWITLKVLRGHMEDIYDLSWSPNSQFLVSGSVDNSAIIWDVHKGKYTAMLKDHKGFVQGVTWDPKNQYVATLSTDRYLRIFDIQTKRVVHRINKSLLPVPEGHSAHGQRVRLFHDDTLQTFFRRLCFTPDGKFLLTPAGVTDYDGATKPINTTYAFSRFAFKQPSIVLPCPDQYTVAVRCCPILYRLRPYNSEKNSPVIPLPYRMIFAVATKSSVYFYDTQQQQPFAMISNIHYTRLTDITWSNDGRIVVVSSTDGFCSLITFEEGELGEEYEDSQAALEAALVNDAMNNNISKKSKKQKENEIQSQKSRKPSTDETGVLATNSCSTAQRQPLAENIIEKKQQEGKQSEKKEVVATPIAFRKKPKLPEPEISTIKESAENVVKVETSGSEKMIAEPARISKPDEGEKTKESIENPNDKLLSTPPKEEISGGNTSLPIKTSLPADIIIDKEILSSDEKFESPEKKARPVTPITVRRQPRTPTSNANVLNKPSIKTPSQSSPPSLVAAQVNSPHQMTSKKATPIAVRRAPRSLITAPCSTPVNEKTVVEEAMDAWPLKDEDSNNKDMTEDKNPQNIEKQSNTEKVESKISEAKTSLTLNETTCEKTEDICLIYEDTVEDEALNDTKKSETPREDQHIDNINTDKKDFNTDNNAATTSKPTDSPQTKPQTPNNKTPRRVPLRTISTPKSKKKILE